MLRSIKQIAIACTAGLALLLIVVFAERYFLGQAEERGRKSGAAIQQAVDVMEADSAIQATAIAAQHRLDSAVTATAARFAHADTVYRTARARLATDTLFQHDTVFQQVLAKADADIAACKDNVLPCEIARANAEHEAAQSRLTITKRDETILNMAHASIPPPRSCTVPTALGGLVGAAAVIVFRH